MGAFKPKVPGSSQLGSASWVTWQAGQSRGSAAWAAAAATRTCGAGQAASQGNVGDVAIGCSKCCEQGVLVVVHITLPANAGKWSGTQRRGCRQSLLS